MLFNDKNILVIFHNISNSNISVSKYTMCKHTNYIDILKEIKIIENVKSKKS